MQPSEIKVGTTYASAKDNERRKVLSLNDNGCMFFWERHDFFYGDTGIWSLGAFAAWAHHAVEEADHG